MGLLQMYNKRLSSTMRRVMGNGMNDGSRLDMGAAVGFGLCEGRATTRYLPRYIARGPRWRKKCTMTIMKLHIKTNQFNS